ATVAFTGSGLPNRLPTDCRKPGFVVAVSSAQAPTHAIDSSRAARLVFSPSIDTGIGRRKLANAAASALNECRSLDHALRLCIASVRGGFGGGDVVEILR